MTGQLPPERSGTPPDLARVAVMRELRPHGLLGVLLSAAAALAVARVADSAVDGVSMLIDGMVRRFDLAILWLTSLLSGARIALHFELDEKDGWLDSFVAAGASRARYAAGLGLGAFLGGSAIFTAGATAFAVGVHLFHDTNELSRLLPRTLPAGLLILAHWCAWFTLIGAVVRRVLPALLLSVGIGALPLIMMFIQIRQGGAVGVGVVRTMVVLPTLIWSDRVLPPMLQLAAMVMFWVLAMVAAERLAGRRT